MLLHCHQTAHIASQYRNTVHEKRLCGAGAHLPPLSGGLQVSLLSQAFDKVDRQLLEAALQDASCPAELISGILELHGKSRVPHSRPGTQGLHSHVQRDQAGVYPCPVLRCLLSCYIYRGLACDLRPDTIQHLTLYADDHHVYWDVRILSDLATATAELGKLLYHLQRLAVNPGKSIALPTSKGKFQTKALKQHVRLKANQRLLLIPCSEGSVSQPQTVPIANSCRYLGVQISYTRAAELAGQHNMRTAPPHEAQRLRVSSHNLSINSSKPLQGPPRTSLGKSRTTYRPDCVFLMSLKTRQSTSMLSRLQKQQLQQTALQDSGIRECLLQAQTQLEGLLTHKTTAPAPLPSGCYTCDLPALWRQLCGSVKTACLPAWEQVAGIPLGPADGARDHQVAHHAYGDLCPGSLVGSSLREYGQPVFPPGHPSGRDDNPKGHHACRGPSWHSACSSCWDPQPDEAFTLSSYFRHFGLRGPPQQSSQ